MLDPIKSSNLNNEISIFSYCNHPWNNNFDLNYLITSVLRLLTQRDWRTKGIPLDVGYRDLNRVMLTEIRDSLRVNNIYSK